MNGKLKRERLIDAASELFHHRGMLSASLADIAKHAEIPIGNVYYYFKTKDELAIAVLEKRRDAMASTLGKLDAMIEDPRERLLELLNFFGKVKEDYTHYGCPIYRMVTDGGEVDKDVITHAAAAIYVQFVDWAQKQFALLGHGEEARSNAMSLLAGIQGGAVVAKSFQNPKHFDDAIHRLSLWVEQLPNKRIFLGKALKMATA